METYSSVASKQPPTKENSDICKKSDMDLSTNIKSILNSEDEVHHFIPYSEYCYVIYHQKDEERVATIWKEYPNQLVTKMFRSSISSTCGEKAISPFTKVRI